MNPVAKAVWFVESHFAGEITLADIAAVAGVSRFHLTRAFGLATGHSVMRYVRGRRLSEAARALAQGAPDILTVALDAGYGSHEAFTRAFREQFAATPEQVRAGRTVDHLSLTEALIMPEPSNVSLEAPRRQQGKAMLIAGLQARFEFEDLAGLPALWRRFADHIGRIPGQAGAVAYGVCHHTDESGFDYLAGVEVSDPSALPGGFARISLPVRQYLVFTHRQHVSAVRGTFMAIFNEWLPKSGYQTEDAPVFERYDERFDPRTGMGGFEIWVPIKA